MPWAGHSVVQSLIELEKAGLPRWRADDELGSACFLLGAPHNLIIGNDNHVGVQDRPVCPVVMSATLAGLGPTWISERKRSTLG
jgi:hypothetical protein